MTAWQAWVDAVKARTGPAPVLSRIDPPPDTAPAELPDTDTLPPWMAACEEYLAIKRQRTVEAMQQRKAAS